MSEGKGNRKKEKELCETTENKPLYHSLGQGCNSWHLCNSFCATGSSGTKENKLLITTLKVAPLEW